MSARIRIRLGDLDIEYEGDDAFIKSDLLDLVSSAIALYEQRSSSVEDSIEDSPPPDHDELAVGTTGNIASKMGAKSGPDLLIAAAARLVLGKGLASFSRQELLKEMKTATAFYKKSYTNNLSKYIQGRVKAGDIVESAKNTYALGAKKEADLRKKLA